MVTQKSQNFLAGKFPGAIMPFSCIFNHNPGAKYFEAKRVQAV